MWWHCKKTSQLRNADRYSIVAAAANGHWEKVDIVVMAATLHKVIFTISLWYGLVKWDAVCLMCRLYGRSCRLGKLMWCWMTEPQTWEQTGSTMPSHKVGRGSRNGNSMFSPSCPVCVFFFWYLISSVPLFSHQPIWPSWLWNWPVTFWPKVAHSSQRSSAPRTTSRCFGSSSSSSRRCRPPSHRRLGTSPLRFLSSVRVSDTFWKKSLCFPFFLWVAASDHIEKLICLLLTRFSCPG